MELSWVILICGAATLVAGLIFVFFGYKLARFLMPLCGTALVLLALRAFVLGALHLDALGTWLFMGGAGVSAYVLLFFFKRVAGFFTGLMGAAFLLLFIAYALNLSGLPYLHPAVFTLCVVSGALALVYKRAGVITFTAVLGGCMAAFAGLYLYFAGIDPGAFSNGIIEPLRSFLSAQKYLVTGLSLILAVAGILVQASVTGKKQMLPGSLSEEQPELCEQAAMRKRIDDINL
jgi:hypothetical protein